MSQIKSNSKKNILDKSSSPMWQWIFQLNDDTPFEDISDIFSEESLWKMKSYLWELIMNFNELENILDEWICDYLNDSAHAIGIAFIYKMSYSQKIDILSDIYRMHLNHSWKRWKLKKILRFDSIIASLRECWSIRNSYVHAYRGRATHDWRIKTKSSFDLDWVNYILLKVWIREIKKTNSFIENTISIFSNFMENIRVY